MEQLTEASPRAAAPLLQLRGVEKQFVQPVDIAGRIANLLGANNQPAVVQAVAGVDLEIRTGEVIGVVGESGCGKSTLGRVIADISPASSGEVSYLGKRLQDMSASERRAYALGVQMIFQNPMASLNPRMRVLDIIGEAPVVHGIVTASEVRDYVAGLMRQVGLDPDYAQRYPHQFSGGQRQRIGIARALALKPRLIVCDEAVAALDVSIQAQVLNLFLELRREFDLTYLFISHNLGVVGHVSDRVVIMYLGRVVESAPTDVICRLPVTKMLAVTGSTATAAPVSRSLAGRPLMETSHAEASCPKPMAKSSKARALEIFGVFICGSLGEQKTARADPATLRVGILQWSAGHACTQLRNSIFPLALPAALM